MTFKSWNVGSLSETKEGGSLFRYHDDWTGEIGCPLPRSETEHRWPLGLHPFFEHLAPEGWLRGRQARAGGVGDEDDFGLLIQYGADCIGAVGIIPVSASDSSTPALPSAPAEEAAVKARRTVSGVQKKLLVWKDDTTFRPAIDADQAATYIAKFNSPDVDTLVQNEALTLRLAREVLGPPEVTEFRVGSVEDIGFALLVKRFDRDGDTRLRLEDFAQILKKPRGRDFRGKYESSYEEAASVIRNHSVRSAIDLSRFFRLVTFNIIVGNADAHLKNFSLLERPEGLRLSPAYDLLNTVVYGQYDADTALAIGGDVRHLEEVDAELLTQLATSIGLPLRAAQLALADLQKAFAKASALKLGERVAPESFHARYVEIVENNLARIFA